MLFICVYFDLNNVIYDKIYPYHCCVCYLIFGHHFEEKPSLEEHDHEHLLRLFSTSVHCSGIVKYLVWFNDCESDSRF